MSTSPITTLSGLTPYKNTTTTTLILSGLPNGTYYFAITALNGSGESGISNVLSVDVMIEPEEPESKLPIAPVTLAILSVGGSAVGISVANVVPYEKLVEPLKNWLTGHQTPSDVKGASAGSASQTGSEASAAESISSDLGDVNTPNDLTPSEGPIISEIGGQTLGGFSAMTPADLVSTLERYWNTLPKNLRDIVLKVMDNYLKFKDQAELVLLNGHHALALGYLGSFEAFREGSKHETISQLYKNSDEAKEAKFDQLSEEATVTATELQQKSDNPANSQEDIPPKEDAE